MEKRMEKRWPWGKNQEPPNCKRFGVSGTPVYTDGHRQVQRGPLPEYRRNPGDHNEFIPGTAVPGMIVQFEAATHTVVAILETRGSAYSESRQVFWLGPPDYDGPTGYWWGEEL